MASRFADQIGKNLVLLHVLVYRADMQLKCALFNVQIKVRTPLLVLAFDLQVVEPSMYHLEDRVSRDLSRP